MSGPKLGRPPKDKALYRQQLLEERLESGERNAVESFFGVGKRRYGLSLVMERLQETSEVAIYVSILTMNLWKRLRALLFALFQGVLRASAWCRKTVVMSLLQMLKHDTIVQGSMTSKRLHCARGFKYALQAVMGTK
jgi:hypothetical protein